MVSENMKDLTWLVLRLTAGVVFLMAGIGKLFWGAAPPVEKVLPFLPAPTTLLLLGLLEVVVGVLIMAGLLTRIASSAAVVLYVIFIVSGVALGMFQAAGLLKDVGLLGGMLALAVFGAHTYSVDAWLAKKR